MLSIPVCSIYASECPYCCPTYQPQLIRKFPYWQWTRPIHTIGLPKGERAEECTVYIKNNYFNNYKHARQLCHRPLILPSDKHMNQHTIIQTLINGIKKAHWHLLCFSQVGCLTPNMQSNLYWSYNIDTLKSSPLLKRSPRVVVYARKILQDVCLLPPTNGKIRGKKSTVTTLVSICISFLYVSASVMLCKDFWDEAKHALLTQGWCEQRNRPIHPAQTTNHVTSICQFYLFNFNAILAAMAILWQGKYDKIRDGNQTNKI